MNLRAVAARRLAGAAGALFLSSGCAAHDSPDDLSALGRSLFDSTALSTSRQNVFSCVTCHDAERPSPARLKPGAALAGATLRPSYWGGQENDLLRAIDDCRSAFMYDGTSLVPGARDADALYAYLAGLEPKSSLAVSFTVVTDISDVPRGDVTRGARQFDAACAECHGAMHTGLGKLDGRIPVLPEDTLAAHPPPTYSPRVQRLVFIEKTRHGLFLNYGGDMPPFSLEVLDDASLGDVLEALGVVGQ